MAEKPNPTTRVQVTLQKGLVDEMDALCEQSHMSRSAWIEYTLAMALNTYRTLLEKGNDVGPAPLA